MRGGDLDRRITLQEEQTTPDGGGGVSVDWIDVATLWASMRQESGREYLAGGAISAERRVIFRLRWRAGVTPQMRIIHGGGSFDIKEVRELGRREGLELHATARE